MLEVMNHKFFGSILDSILCLHTRNSKPCQRAEAGTPLVQFDILWSFVGKQVHSHDKKEKM